MRFERSFSIPRPPAAVLADLTDVERIASVLPGGLVDGRARGGRFGGQFALQLGSAAAPYSAIIEVTDRDEAAGRGVVGVRANDDEGDGTADVAASFTVGPGDPGSDVVVVVEVTLGGRLADVPDADDLAQTYARNAIAQLRAGVVAGEGDGGAADEPAGGAEHAAGPAAGAAGAAAGAGAGVEPARAEPEPSAAGERTAAEPAASGAGAAAEEPAAAAAPRGRASRPGRRARRRRAGCDG